MVPCVTVATAFSQQLTEPVGEFTDPVRGVKASFKVGLKGGIHPFNPTLKLASTSRTGSVNSGTAFTPQLEWRQYR